MSNELTLIGIVPQEQLTALQVYVEKLQRALGVSVVYSRTERELYAWFLNTSHLTINAVKSLLQILVPSDPFIEVRSVIHAAGCVTIRIYCPQILPPFVSNFLQNFIPVVVNTMCPIGVIIDVVFELPVKEG